MGCSRESLYTMLVSDCYGVGSKSRRKDERKRLSGKEGSQFEDEYLVVTLRTSVRSATGPLKGTPIRLFVRLVDSRSNLQISCGILAKHLHGWAAGPKPDLCKPNS